jgi:hypothetical protein
MSCAFEAFWSKPPHKSFIFVYFFCCSGTPDVEANGFFGLKLAFVFPFTALVPTFCFVFVANVFVPKGSFWMLFDCTFTLYSFCSFNYFLLTKVAALY